MSIVDSNKIDAISINENDEVLLSIADHLDWENTIWHLNQLQDKLNSYIQFIEGGQIFDDYPSSKGRKLVIQIVSKEEYNYKGLEFLKKIRPIILSIGVDLRQRVLRN